ncbi:MAG: hypothetical protein LPD71_05490 [Shewanella sp.]|nr:hypothetical protein [Shewanella sp.]MCF1430396.1 hypothetical protein [Shewanella sp.]MCF1438204.1 hypothetical protein [Shewanella sp.]MCF1457363.1 hypothetical protein [Shewanella sp.]
MLRLVFICFFSLLALQPWNRVAASPIELHHNQAVTLVASGQILSLTDTLAIVSHYCKGKLMDAHLYQEGNKWRYDLELKVDKGQLLQISVDARSGKPVAAIPLPSECQQNEITAR